jgi:hypothetical protein
VSRKKQKNLSTLKGDIIMFKKAKGILFFNVFVAVILAFSGKTFAVNPDYIAVQDLGGYKVSLSGNATQASFFLWATTSLVGANFVYPLPVYLCKLPGTSTLYLTADAGCSPGTRVGYAATTNQSFTPPGTQRVCLSGTTWPPVALPNCVNQALGPIKSTVVKRTTLSFAQAGNNQCTGRCGIGCTWMPYEASTPECLAHDQCLANSFTANPVCWGPLFDAAAQSYIFAIDPVYNKASNFFESFLSDLF